MEIRQLRCFLEVAEQLSFSVAARRLYLAQPAVSRVIQALEREVGAQLLVRRPVVALTAAGEALLPLAASIVAEADLAAQTIRQRGTYSDDRLRVGYFVDFGDGLLDDLLRRFACSRPDVQVDVRKYDFDNPTAGVLDGGTDIALADTYVTAAGLSRQPLHRDEHVAVLSAASSLGEQDVLTVEQLDRSDLLFATPPVNDPGWQLRCTAAHVRGGLPEKPFFPASLQEFLGTVAEGHAVGLIARSIVEANPVGGLTWRPVHQGLPYGTELLFRYCHAERRSVRAFREFVAFDGFASLIRCVPAMRSSIE